MSVNIIEIPGYKTLELSYLLLDYNGTIALDGAIPSEVRERLVRLGDDYTIYVLTADTHGTAASMCEGLPVTIYTFPSDAAMYEKQRILRELGADKCVAIGNGRNDVLMCQEAALGIGIIGGEGAHGPLLSQVDICVSDICDALDLFLYPKRIIATLRG